MSWWPRFSCFGASGPDLDDEDAHGGGFCIQLGPWMLSIEFLRRVS